MAEDPATSQYNAYCKEYGYPPSNIGKLMIYARTKNGVKFSPTDAKKAMNAAKSEQPETVEVKPNIRPRTVKNNKAQKKKDNKPKPQKKDKTQPALSGVGNEIKPAIHEKKEIQRMNNASKQWMIYDFKRFELRQIVLTFAKDHVPNTLTLKMSDVAPRYAFKECKASKEWALNANKTTHRLDLSGDAYDAGFKRYICVEFNGYDWKKNLGVKMIESIQFFGALSNRISDDDEQFQEQFDTEEKKDPSLPYAPVIVDSCETQQGQPIDNIWKEEDHLMWMAKPGSDPWFVVDLGNNKADQVHVQGYYAYTFKTVKVWTSDAPKSKKWTLLVQDDKMDTKMANGGRYDLTKHDVGNYLKIELAGSVNNMYTINHFILFGGSKFLTKEEQPLTMDDIKNMKYYDHNLIAKFRKQGMKVFGAELQDLTMKRIAIEGDPNKGKFCKEWEEAQKAYYKCVTENGIVFTLIDAYTADTVFEQECILKIAEKQREVARDNAKCFLKFDTDWNTREVELKKQGHEEYHKAMVKHGEDMQKLHADKRNIINKMRTNNKAKQIYGVWKQAIMTNPRFLSSQYTVIEYENAITHYGRSQDEDGIREAYHRISELFEQALKQKRDDIIHKFFVYQLNAALGEHTTMLAFYGNALSPVVVILNVGAESILDMEIKCSAHAKDIAISTADEAKEEGDEIDDVWDLYHGFDIIAKATNDGKATNMIHLGGKNKQFIKIEFNNWNDTKICPFEIHFVKLFAKGKKDVTSKVKIVAANDQANIYDGTIDMIFKANGSYLTCVVADDKGKKLEDKIRDHVCRGVNLLRQSRGNKISKNDKHFIKFLLCFQNRTHYDEMLYSAKLVMGLLRKPLDIEYKRLQSIKSPILTLKLDAKYRCGKEIKSNHKLLEWDYSKWYEPRKALLWPQDLKPLSEAWQKMGLLKKDDAFKHLQRKHPMVPKQLFVTSDDLAMEYLNLIAYKLDNSFQKTMKELFKENRLKLGRSYPTNNNDLDVQSGPVKTKARQKIKVDLKYYLHPKPCCMSVLDIVRCGIVCEDDVELCALYQLIMERFKGSILRVKNAFDDIRKGDDSHGYRAVMININFGNESVLPEGYKMVCEAQLLLNKYYQVRKDMHLGYGICRSEDGGQSDNTMPYVILARDCAKFGKLDI